MTSANDDNATKPCKMCGEPIKRVARVCPHCMNAQDWREHLGFSHSVLALLVALISVATVFIPVLQEAFTSDNSQLEFSFQSAERVQAMDGVIMTLLATNNGSRPGTIFRVYLADAPTMNTSKKAVLGMENETRPFPTTLVERESSQLVTVFFNDLPSPTALYLIVATRDFKGQVSGASVPVRVQ